MARFAVFFSAEADEEVLKSYEWGLLFWGQDQANIWLAEFYASVIGRLGEFPLGCGLAQENAFLDSEIRQCHIGRYRVLFEIDGDEVTVIRVVGPFSKLNEGESIPLK